MIIAAACSTASCQCVQNKLWVNGLIGSEAILNSLYHQCNIDTQILLVLLLLKFILWRCEGLNLFNHKSL